jgi:Domain of unknown function (DUF1330)
MTAYVVCEVKIKDHDQYAREIVPIFTATHKEYGGRMLVRTDEPATFCLLAAGWFCWSFQILIQRDDGGTVPASKRLSTGATSCGSTAS